MEKTTENYTIKTAKTPSGNVLIYEFGARLDKECAAAVDGQIKLARGLYNNIVALMRDTPSEMQADLLDKAGPSRKGWDGVQPTRSWITCWVRGKSPPKPLAFASLRPKGGEFTRRD